MDADQVAPPAFGSPPQYPIESVDNALKVLLLLGHRPHVRITEVSRHLEVASSTAHRLLAMLQFRGFVRQEASTHRYLPGPTLDEVAMGVLRRLDVRARARPVLERLNVELQETVHLGRLEGDKVHFLDSIESSRALRVGGRLGRSMSAHCTSTGKVLLAGLTEEELELLYPEERLPQLTSHSIGDRRTLRAVLADVRAQGFATSVEESEDGVSSVAVALRGGAGSRLAVTASAPVSRMSNETRAVVLRHLSTAVEEIDQMLP